MKFKHYCIMVGIAFGTAAMKERDALHIVKCQPMSDDDLLKLVMGWTRVLWERGVFSDHSLEFELRNRLRVQAGMQWRNQLDAPTWMED